jgi:hypothetical protein
MKIETKDILPKLKAFLATLRKYAVGIAIGVVILIYGYLVFKIGTISAVEPNEEAVTEQLQDTQRLRIDQEAINKIQQLEDQNVGVRSLFKAARDNPFQEN